MCVKFPEIPVYYLTVRNTDYSEDTPVNLSMIGPRIQQERKARGMTQSVLAEKVEITIGTRKENQLLCYKAIFQLSSLCDLVLQNVLNSAIIQCATKKILPVFYS